MTALPPGSTIGILGGGQLARMLALAAARLGLKAHIYAPETDSPAFDVAAAHTMAAYDDEQALSGFSQAIGAATYEFENIPVSTVEFLAKRVTVRPGAKALACAQDRINEKVLARKLGAMTADFAAIDSLASLQSALRTIAPPAVLKTRRLGYDGKGQAKILNLEDAKAAWDAMHGQPSILEAFVNFSREVSVVAARSADGEFRAFDVTENEHRNHILHRSIAPARMSTEARDAAIAIAKAIGERLDYVGVYAIEFFAKDQSGGGVVMCVNEMAPRVHNSGHWTMDGCETSQFEQHIRAVAGWPLGSTKMTSPGAEMINLIGDDVLAWRKIAAEPGSYLHHYGKKDARPGRKMGHVNYRLSKAPQ